jgi:hypothetical protein
VAQRCERDCDDEAHRGDRAAREERLAGVLENAGLNNVALEVTNTRQLDANTLRLQRRKDRAAARGGDVGTGLVTLSAQNWHRHARLARVSSTAREAG